MPHLLSKKRTNITLDYDLYQQAKCLGINISKLTNEAIIAIVKQKQEQQLESELKQTINSINCFMEEAGTFDDMETVW